MLKNYFSKYEIDNYLLKSAIILIDTREQENKHITDYFDKKGIGYIVTKLEFGDYSLLLPENKDRAIPYDMRLDFAIERKHNLEELSGNFTKDRNRIEQELFRGKNKMIMLVENGSFDMILANDYQTNYNNKSYIATILSYGFRYNIPFYFCDKKNAGLMIHAILIYKLREELKWWYKNWFLIELKKH